MAYNQDNRERDIRNQNQQQPNDRQGTSNRGFASMDPERQREIASMGGQASGGNFRNDPQRAAEAGRKGGLNSHGVERGRNSENDNSMNES